MYNIVINEAVINDFLNILRTLQLSEATIKKYGHNLALFMAYTGECVRDIDHFLGFRDYIREKKYGNGTINSIYGSVNKFMRYLNADFRLRYERIQRQIFLPPNKELTIREYDQLLNTAKERKNHRLYMMLQTICGTGIRVSELRFITVESLSPGMAVISNKGKVRTVLIPSDLIRNLRKYCHEMNITSGPIFITRTGNPLDRSNICKMLKRLAELAGVSVKKVFPHNLRHLFARSYYEKYHDIARLADILGHSNVNTTRIYTADSGQAAIHMIDGLGLVPTN